jgi:hypothetical protein
MVALINFSIAAICERLWEVCTEYAGFAFCEQNSLLPAGQRQMFLILVAV